MATLTATPNPYADRARLAKVIRLADALERIPFALVLEMAPADWARVAAIVNVHPPSEETRAMVIERLRERAERPANVLVIDRPAPAPCVVCAAPSSALRSTSLTLRALPVCGEHDRDLCRCHWCSAIVPLSGPHACEAMEREQAAVMAEYEREKQRVAERVAERARRDFDAIDGRNRLAERVGGDFRCPQCGRTKPAERAGEVYGPGDARCRSCVADGNE